MQKVYGVSTLSTARDQLSRFADAIVVRRVDIPGVPDGREVERGFESFSVTDSFFRSRTEATLQANE